MLDEVRDEVLANYDLKQPMSYAQKPSLLHSKLCSQNQADYHELTVLLEYIMLDAFASLLRSKLFSLSLSIEAVSGRAGI